MKKLSTQIVLWFNLFTILLVGIFLCWFHFYAEDYCISQRKASIEKTFAALKKINLQDTDLEVENLNLDFQEEGYVFLICNSKFESVCLFPNPQKEQQLVKRIKRNVGKYRKNAKAYYMEKRNAKPVILRGMIVQDGKKYYVHIQQNTRVIRKSIRWIERKLPVFFGIFLCIEALVSFVVVNGLLQPLKRVEKAVSSMKENEFSVRIEQNPARNELTELSNDLNLVAEMVQEKMSYLKNYNYLLLKQNKEMFEFENMRKKLVGKITHQLKTPLAIISSQVELSMDETNPQKREYYANSVMEEVEKMSLLIRGLLQNSKMENQFMNGKMRKLNLSNFLEELAIKYNGWITSNHICFCAEIEPQCIAYIDKAQIEHALNNYMMNALRHTQRGRHISLQLHREDEWYVISVYNEGECLAESELESIWTDFYQVSDYGEYSVTEVGLGLYIVKDIMRQQNGLCGVENCDEGVKFWLKIPVDNKKREMT